MSSSLPTAAGGGGLRRLSPRRVTGIYLLFGLLFLLVSDLLLPALIVDPGLLRSLQAVKGAVEVLITGGLIYVLTATLERQLRRSRRRYRNLIETSPVPINLFDGDGEIIWGNDAALELLGVDDREELVGRSIFEFIHPDDHDVARRERASVVEGGDTAGPTYMRLRRDDGSGRQIRVSTAPGTFRGERVGQAVVVDVTELREVQADLRAERDFIEKALDQLGDLFYVVDADEELLRWNERVPEVTGYDDEELESAHATEFFPPEDRQRIADAIESALEKGTYFVEADLVTDDGERRYEFRGARLDGRGDANRVVGIGRDVSERRRMERELRENEQRYRTLVEMSPHSILVHTDGEIVYANQAFVDLVDADGEDDVLGEHINAFLHPDQHEDAERTATRTQRGIQAPTDNRRTIVTREGRERHVETTSRPIAYEDEPAVLTISTDVTQRHRYEEMLTTLHERTRAMTRAGDRERIARIAAETASDVLDAEACAVYGFDGGDELHPLARSGDVAEPAGELPAARRGESVLWDAFVAGEERTVEGEEDGIEGFPGSERRSAVVLPLGNHGVLAVVLRGELPLTTTRRRLLNLVAENLTAAFDRAERERDLRERDRRLERQNEALEQLNRLSEIIREINQALVRSSTRAEIMEGACERITAADQYSFAWIGVRDSPGEHATPRHSAGMDPEYRDYLDASDARTPLQDLVAAAFRENSVQVARNVLDDPDWADHRSRALNHDYRSVAAVPVAVGEHVDSVLVIHAADGDIFDERERAVLEELGDTIGYALRNVERTSPVQSNARTEVDLRIDDEGLFTNRITTALDVDVEFVGAVEGDGDAIQLFLRIAGAPAEAVESALEPFETVTELRPLSVDDGKGLYRLTVAVLPLVRVLQRTGLRLRSLTAEDGCSTLTGVLPGDVSVRSVVEELRSEYPDAELSARRPAPEPVDTHETFRDRLLDRLTGRQREALRTAFFSGFYEWPRETKSEELAEMLDIASSTYQYHLRAAERTVVESVMEPG